MKSCLTSFGPFSSNKTTSDEEKARNARRHMNVPDLRQPLLVRQWKYLWPQESVQLRYGSEVIATGWIDDITTDATTLWVQLSEGRGRKMIHQGDGIDVWRLDFQIYELPLQVY
ncbi:hypothetical protein AB0284_14460 [Pseudarthrobacter phenanthrenivorans]|uniref:hypothetical protein n=1 Tax=Pseudarthrobacter phenanthrenivorans TaxID=361575 RepID=UPI003450737C